MACARFRILDKGTVTLLQTCKAKVTVHCVTSATLGIPREGLRDFHAKLWLVDRSTSAREAVDRIGDLRFVIRRTVILSEALHRSIA